LRLIGVDDGVAAAVVAVVDHAVGRQLEWLSGGVVSAEEVGVEIGAVSDGDELIEHALDDGHESGAFVVGEGVASGFGGDVVHVHEEADRVVHGGLALGQDVVDA
jgi:hypothetical protein